MMQSAAGLDQRGWVELMLALRRGIACMLARGGAGGEGDGGEGEGGGGEGGGGEGGGGEGGGGEGDGGGGEGGGGGESEGGGDGCTYIEMLE